MVRDFTLEQAAIALREVHVPDVMGELRDQVFDEGDITFHE